MTDPLFNPAKYFRNYPSEKTLKDKKKPPPYRQHFEIKCKIINEYK